MVRVKICGITNLEDALAAVDAGVDALGFIFSHSPRRISREKAVSIIRQIPPFIIIVGVFVNEDREKIEKTLKKCSLHTLQFHGDESPDYCRSFAPSAKIIKAFPIRNKESLLALNCYSVDGYLLDTYSEGKMGGTGKTFNWDLACQAKEICSPIILSGGLSVDNVGEAINYVKPYGIDVSSGIESSPGKKDHYLMRKFIRKCKFHL